MTEYIEGLENIGDCTFVTLAKEACISETIAMKGIQSVAIGVPIPTKVRRGNSRIGVGSLKGFTREHSEYLYTLYKSNPALPLYGYCEEF